MENSETKKALLSVKNVVEKYNNNLPKRVSRVLEEIEDALLRLELGDKLDTFIPEYHSPSQNYVDLSMNGIRNHEVSLLRFGGESKSQISFPDDGEQPEDGWYLRFSFSCGAYTFSGDYPTKSFNAFFSHLKSYGARYCDTVNNDLYFSLDKELDKARNVYRDYKDLFARYRKEGQEETLSKRIKDAETQLAKLKNGVGGE